MTLPSNWQAQIEEGQRLRGWLVNSFAQVEYLLGDLILRCRAFPEYDEHTRKLPHGATDRIAKVRAMLNRPGPLDAVAVGLRDVLDHLTMRQDTRNLLVHGFGTFLHTPSGDTGFHFQKFHRHSGRQDARLIQTFTLEQLRAERDEQAAHADVALTLFQDLHSRMGWTGPMASNFIGDQPFQADPASR